LRFLADAGISKRIVEWLHDTSTPHVIERLEAVLKVSSPQLEQGGVVVVVEETRHRVRAFPKKPQAPE
jgi:hypothetical protein